MDTSFLPQGHPTIATRKVGVLLINLGTPDATDYWSMRRYLKEFLSDRRVIDLNRFAWWLILNLFILTKRPFTSGKLYKKIWNTERNESPLMTTTRSQCDKLQQRMPHVVCEWAMRYGNPSIARGIDSLTAQGCDSILLFAMYPQYAAPTTATVYDKAFDKLKTMKWQPAIRCVPSYHDDPVYIKAISESVQQHLAQLPWKPDMLLASFHGVPKRYLLEGDPYHCLCMKTARLLRDHLSWPQTKWTTCFQSRFGSEEWLRPYTDKTTESLAQTGQAKNIAILSPGFVADCLETLEELNVELRHQFAEAGGQNFTYIPCLNDSEAGIDVIEHITRKELLGWI